MNSHINGYKSHEMGLPCFQWVFLVCILCISLQQPYSEGISMLIWIYLPSKHESQLDGKVLELVIISEHGTSLRRKAMPTTLTISMLSFRVFWIKIFLFPLTAGNEIIQWDRLYIILMRYI